jgi:AcrR family transcriptional regulator
MIGRPKTFDINSLLDQSISLFWRQGFQGTSVRDVAKAANLTTGTLYNEFGGKEDLFAATIKHYFKQIIKPRVDNILLADEPAFLNKQTVDSGFVRIHYFLTSSVHQLPTAVAHQACLLVNTSNELGQGDSPVHREINKANRYINNALKKVLLNKQEANAAHIKQQLLQIHVFMTGLLVTAKHVKDTRTLIPTVDAFIQQLKSSI